MQDQFIVCVKCFKSGNLGENESVDDFELKNCGGNSATSEAVWTEEETLLLLDSVLKHGDDWDLVAQNVKTKSKSDCITKLIELPFGESLIDSAKGSGNSTGHGMNMNSTKSAPVPSSEHQENSVNKDQDYDGKYENEQNGDSENQEPPLKKKRTACISDADSSLMKQVNLFTLYLILLKIFLAVLLMMPSFHLAFCFSHILVMHVAYINTRICTN